MKKILFSIVLASFVCVNAQDRTTNQVEQNTSTYLTFSPQESQRITPEKLKKQQEFQEQEQQASARSYLAYRGATLQANASRSVAANFNTDIICAGEETEITVRIYPLHFPVIDFYAHWDFGDGTPIKITGVHAGYLGEVTTQHTYMSEGNYRVRVTIYDLNQNQIIGSLGDTAEKLVEVEDCRLPLMPVNPNIHLTLGN
ncbi:PKD domain-containing protein [Myroides sp. DW712]|uniref:PKD domain-containing protein n=1 Tax=Myroides sp. DW712 TaxID=3389800 RepID=UPI00397E07AB